jgi:hypothetical protein
MSRRLFLILFAALAVILVVGVAVHPSRPRSQITKENFERIKLGVHLTEVEKLLGGPPGTYSRARLVADHRPEDPDIDPEGWGEALLTLRLSHLKRAPVKVWVGDWGLINVSFDGDGRVTGKGFWSLHPKSESVLGRLRRWLRF